MESEDPAGVVLDVYDGGTGLWNPDRGELDAPEGWEVLPTGDPFVTRQVKASGTYWMLWRPRSRSQRHRRLIGVLAPADRIAAARAAASTSLETRLARRTQASRSSARAEETYRHALEAAIVAYLDFDPEHAVLAKAIATEAAAQAAEVGSGRVGRTRKLSLDERAVFAARALIRHRHTDYEDRLISEVWDDDYLYREVKAAAQEAVDEFLRGHQRQPPRSGETVT